MEKLKNALIVTGDAVSFFVKMAFYGLATLCDYLPYLQKFLKFIIIDLFLPAVKSIFRYLKNEIQNKRRNTAGIKLIPTEKLNYTKLLYLNQKDKKKIVYNEDLKNSIINQIKKNLSLNRNIKIDFDFTDFSEHGTLTAKTAGVTIKAGIYQNDHVLMVATKNKNNRIIKEFCYQIA